MANWQKIRSVTAYSVLGSAVLSFSLWYYFGVGGIRDANILRETYDSQKLEIAKRELRKQELNDYLSAVQREDGAALELAARRYGLVGEDEYMWKVDVVPADTSEQ